MTKQQLKDLINLDWAERRARLEEKKKKHSQYCKDYNKEQEDRKKGTFKGAARRGWLSERGSLSASKHVK